MYAIISFVVFFFNLLSFHESESAFFPVRISFYEFRQQKTAQMLARRSVIGFIKIARIDPIPHKECVQRANLTEIAIFMIISIVMRVAFKNTTILPFFECEAIYKAHCC